MSEQQRKERIAFLRNEFHFVNVNRKVFEKELGKEWVEEFIDEILDELNELSND